MGEIVPEGGIGKKSAAVVAPFAVVPETRFGFWFLGTQTWVKYVLSVAINDLTRLISDRQSVYPVILDVGCGQGHAFRFLKAHFSAERLIGVDVEEQGLRCAQAQVTHDNLVVEFLNNNATSLDIPDASVDMLFCHQTLHHLVHQEQALAEFYRVLKPGGLLLIAESTRAYIHSWIIRLLFRHPMEVQRSAEEYLAMLKAQGFTFGPENISYPYLWWSRADLGIGERLGFPPPQIRHETLLNVVARKR